MKYVLVLLLISCGVIPDKMNNKDIVSAVNHCAESGSTIIAYTDMRYRVTHIICDYNAKETTK